MTHAATRISSDMPNIRVRLTADQFEQIVALAEKNERSVPAEIRIAVKAYLNGKGKS